MRNGKWKAHWGTGPGLGGCPKCVLRQYNEVPLLFNLDEDPSEAYPLTLAANCSKGVVPRPDCPTAMPKDPALRAVVVALNAAFDKEQATFTWGKLVSPPLGPGEDANKFGICCDATKDGGTKPVANATCDCNGAPYKPPSRKHRRAPAPIHR